MVEAWLNALAIEVSLVEQPHTLETLFIGGGTPSYLSAEQLTRMREILATRFELQPDAEVTAECNPTDVSESSLESLASIGVNRISLGVQSFRDEKLKTLERDHTGDQARRAVRLSQDRIGNVSFDLIFAAPSESIEQWTDDLAVAIDLKPDHISTYELTFEKGTTFWTRLQRRQLVQSDEELRAEMFETAVVMLREAGLDQYEVSSFACPGRQCRHNRVYWTGKPWLAFGPGAASYVDGVRRVNHASTTNWMRLLHQRQSAVVEEQSISPLEAAKERLAIALRLVEGIEVKDLESETGFSIGTIIGPAKEMLITENLISLDNRCRLTDHGILMYDGVAEKIIVG